MLKELRQHFLITLNKHGGEVKLLIIVLASESNKENEKKQKTTKQIFKGFYSCMFYIKLNSKFKPYWTRSY